MTGYQLHVRTFTLHTVLKTVADSYTPPNPPSVDIRPVASSSSSTGAKSAAEATSAKDGGGVAAMEVVECEEGTTDEAQSSAVAPAVPLSLVRPPFDACIPEVVELLMEDLFGETAAAKEVRARGEGTPGGDGLELDVQPSFLFSLLICVPGCVWYRFILWFVNVDIVAPLSGTPFSHLFGFCVKAVRLPPPP